MIFRRFFAAAAAMMLVCTLLCGNFAHLVVADVFHAYRTPSEADIQWLRGVDLASATDSSSPNIIQVGFTTPSKTMLMPRPGPCNPAHVPVPLPSVPPPPQTSDSTMHSGLAPDPDGVVNIAPIIAELSAPVVQMTSERLSPPTEVPREDSLVAPLAVLPAAPPSLLLSEDYQQYPQGISDYSASDHYIGCGTSYNRKPRVFAPDMIGSSAWLTGYSVATNNTPFTMPTMLQSRPNVVERFNAHVQDRIWADYRHWNNAVSSNNVSRAVEQFSFGLETRVLRNSSVELRLPLISQFASKQTADHSATSVELGNISVVVKQVLAQNSRWTISGGAGTSLPTAEDYRLPGVSTRLKNNAYDLVSFFGIQWHPNNGSFGHFVLQADMPIEKNELIVGNGRYKIDGQQVIRTGFQLGHWLYRIDDIKRPARLGFFTEINYAMVMEGSPQYNGGDMSVSAVDSQKSTLTAAIGLPMVFGKSVFANSLILPISGSQRPFSVGYSFSLSRQF